MGAILKLNKNYNHVLQKISVEEVRGLLQPRFIIMINLI